MLRPANFNSDTVPVETTAGLIYPIAPILKLKVETRSTIYFTLRNGSGLHNDVTINFSHDATDTSVSCTVTLEPNEVVTIPVPTGGASNCSISGTEKTYLLKLEYAFFGTATQSFMPFGVNFSAGVTKGFSLNGFSANLLAGSSAQILFNQPASSYKLDIIANKPIIVLRGRLRYNVLGLISLIIDGEFKQDIHITAEAPTNLNLQLSAIAIAAVSSNNHDFTFRV